MKEKDQAKNLAGTAPPLSDGELSEINSGYTAYIFRRSKTREIWTSCCGRHEIIPKQEYSDAFHAVLASEHQAEESNFNNAYYRTSEPVAEYKTRVSTPCPLCGADAYVKELGRTGKRDNLASYRRFVVFRWHRGVLWARAYDTTKKYGPPGSLTLRPEWNLYKVYRFKPGEAVCASRYYFDGDFAYYNRMVERPKKLPLRFYEPFSHNSAEGSGYTVVGLDEIEKSPFKYCQLDKFLERSNSAMRYLAVCCIFPRQVEMLMKAGMIDPVSDLVHGRKWNAAAFDWSEANPLDSFDLDKNEMKEYLSSGKNLEALTYYKQFRRQKIKCSIPEVQEVMKVAPYLKVQSTVMRMKKCRVEPSRWIEYIKRETESANRGKKKNLMSVGSVAQFWIDYVDAAEVLGYDLKNPIMSTPKGIIKKHNQAVKAVAPILAARRKTELSAKEKKMLENNTARYEYTDGKYILRAAISADEIVDEGKVLKHCVGGYADRHVNGKLTIVFLRTAADPFAPLVTIEMMGSRMVQIHGYKNDVNAKIKPRDKYAEILDPWLDWIQAGSKRDKDGNPVMRRKKKERKEVLAAAV